MPYKVKWHRRIAHKLGYDLAKFNKQLTIETHLRTLLPKLGINLVLDVGANLGQYAQMLRYIGYQGEIISFEPAADTFTRLEKLTRGDNRWTAHPLALSDTNGSAELHRSGSSDFNSLHAASDFGLEKYGASIESAQTETIQLMRLDEFAASTLDLSNRRVFLKMDTQGHDLVVLEGAGGLATTFAGLQSEIAVLPIYRDIPDYMDSLAFYRRQGYEVTGLFPVHRHRGTGHVVEFDCVMVPGAGLSG